MKRASCLALSCAATLLLSSCLHNADRAKRAALQKGQQLYAKADYANASLEFQKAAHEDGNFGDAYYWMGRTQNRLGNFAEAMAALRRAATLMPADERPKIELANILLVAYLGSPGRPTPVYQEVSRIAGELTAKDRASFDGNRLQGYLATIDGHPAKAVEYFESANRIKPNEPDVVTAWANDLMASGEPQKAEQLARDFIRIRPAYGPLYTFLYQYFMRSKRTPEAEEILKSKVDHNPAVSLYRIELARHYLQTGNKAAMAAVLNQLSASPKEIPHGYLDAGDFYAQIGDRETARHEYEKGEQNDAAERLTYMKRLVRLDISANDAPDARQLLDRILKEKPRDLEARSSRAALQMSSNDSAERKLALTELSKLAEESDDSRYRLEYADALRSAGDPESARKQYLAILSKQPGNIEALEDVADLYIRAEHIDEALRFADQALARDPSSVRARLVRSAGLATQGRYAETRQVLNSLAQDHPGLREVQLQLALLDTAEKHYLQAEERFRKNYTPGKGDIRSLKGLIELYRAQNRMDQAIALLRRDLEQGPQSIEVRALLAKTLAQTGHAELAIVEYEKVSQMRADSPETAVELGLSYQAAGNSSAAIGQFEKASRLAPRIPLPHAYLAKVLDESGRKQEALAEYRRSLALDSHNPWVNNNSAYLIAETGGDLDEALKLAGEAVRLQPDNPSFRDTIGWIYYKKKDLVNAVHVLQSVRDKNPKEVSVRIHLSQALLAMGDKNRYRGELESALTLPCTPEERSMIGRLLEETRQVR